MAERREIRDHYMFDKPRQDQETPRNDTRTRKGCLSLLIGLVPLAFSYVFNTQEERGPVSRG